MTPDELQSHLTAYFARGCHEHSMGPVGALMPLAGGFASSLYTFAGDRTRTLVLKLYAPNNRGREHAAREWRALTYLRSRNYPVPRAVIFELDARHLGHPFVIMEHISASSFWQFFEAADPATQARLTRSYVAQLVALQDLDPLVLDPAAVPRPYGYLDRELEQLRRDGAGSPHAKLPEVLQWLEQTPVPGERPVILHRDYHPWNVLVDAAENLWVIDWDWQIGDARFDLAWTCTLMDRSGFHDFTRAVRDEYAHRSSFSLNNLDYFEVLTTVRWLLNVLPSTHENALSNPATQADFRTFLVKPVAHAQKFLEEKTGIRMTVKI